MNSEVSTHIRPAYANIARPYALAAFECASEKQTLLAWKSFLASAALIASQREVVLLLSNPEITELNWLNFFAKLLGNEVDKEKKNFLALLAHNKRIIVLPEIAALFNDYYNIAHKNTYIKLVTAIPLNKEMEQAFIDTLTKRTNKTVSLQCEVNPAVLGGAIIHIDDKVIDASLHGRLTRLLAFSLR